MEHKYEMVNCSQPNLRLLWADRLRGAGFCIGFDHEDENDHTVVIWVHPCEW